MTKEQQVIKIARNKNNKLRKALRTALKGVRPKASRINQYMFTDIPDLIQIYDNIIKRDFESARESAFDLDTLLRDEIPGTIYNFLESLFDS